MQPLAPEVIKSFNKMLNVLPADTLLSLVQFDSLRGADVTLSLVPIEEVRPLDSEAYRPDGGTPLYDAIAEAVTLGVRGETVLKTTRAVGPLIAIISDGAENASEFTNLSAIRSIVAERVSTGWEVRYFGLGPDASAEGARLGLPATSVSDLALDADAVGDVFSEIGAGLATSRSRC
jgi:hypothetical protein